MHMKSLLANVTSSSIPIFRLLRTITLKKLMYQRMKQGEDSKFSEERECKMPLQG